MVTRRLRQTFWSGTISMMSSMSTHGCNGSSLTSSVTKVLQLSEVSIARLLPISLLMATIADLTGSLSFRSFSLDQLPCSLQSLPGLWSSASSFSKMLVRIQVSTHLSKPSLLTPTRSWDGTCKCLSFG